MLTLFQRPHIKHLATSLALALLPGLAQATSEVLIQSQQNGLYVCVSSGYLSAICPSDQAIRFEMEEFETARSRSGISIAGNTCASATTAFT